MELTCAKNADLPFLKSQTGRIEPGGSRRTEIMGSPSRSGGFMSRGVSNHAQSDKAVYAGLRSRLHSHKLWWPFWRNGWKSYLKVSMGTQVGQYHSSGLIHCPGHYHQKYSVDHVVECSEISTHGLEKEICPVKLAPRGCWLLARIGAYLKY